MPLEHFILRLARENSNWGRLRIQGALAHLNHPIAPSTAWEILHATQRNAAQRSATQHKFPQATLATLVSEGPSAHPAGAAAAWSWSWINARCQGRPTGESSSRSM
ncbi:hypothetical protein [Streptomyces sp. CB01635]|uniref:hypothetical protein n=1 Tax=unclassified Streptomyces TaxID=2593676 RepID=UPI0018FE17AC|nr:hypothetical protein [Streptomyces sp. CB01635]